MKESLPIIQLVAALVMTAFILLQGKGAGLGGSFGGSGELYRSKRGFERTLFIATIVSVGVFFITAIVNILVS